jgi:HEAT repeat protein
MKRPRKRIVLLILLCVIPVVVAYAALPYVAPAVVIRHDPSYRRVVTAVAQGIGTETYAAMRDRMRSAGARDVTRLMDLLVALEGPWERQCVIEILLETPDPRRIPPETLHRTLTDSNENVAFWSAILLGRIGSKESAPHLFAALSDMRPRVVLHAAEALLAMHADDPGLPSVRERIAELTNGRLKLVRPEGEPDGPPH